MRVPFARRQSQDLVGAEPAPGARAGQATGGGTGSASGTAAWWLPVAVLAVLVLAYEPRLTLNRGLVIPDDFFTSDLMNDRYPARAELGRALRDGYLPLWTRLIYCGFPLQANPETGLTYPPNLLLFGLLPPALALNLSILSKFFLAGLFVLLLLRQLRVGPAAALFGAVAFAWCGFCVAQLRHLNMHDAAIWVPLLLYLLERYRADRRMAWLGWTALVFGLQTLAGHPQISYYTGLLLGVYLLWIELPNVRRAADVAGVAVRLGGCLGLGVALGMVQLLPTLELVHWSERAGGVTQGFANEYQYHLPDLLTFVLPFANGDPGQGTYRTAGIFWEDYGYVGLLPLAAAAFAVAAGLRRDRTVRFFTAVGVVAGLVMLGDQAGLHWLAYRLLPGMDYFRFATRLVLIVDLCLCILAGLGLHRLLTHPRAARFRPAWVAAACVAVLVVDLFATQRRLNPVVSRAEWERLPATAEFIRRDPDPLRTYPLGAVQTHLAAYTQAHGWQGDLSPYVRQRAALQPSANMLHGVATTTGYMNLVPRHLIALWGNEKGPGLVERAVRVGPDNRPLLDDAFVRSLSAYGGKYMISVWPLAHPALSVASVHEGYAVYRNAAVQPRCRIVPPARARLVRPAEEGLLLEALAVRGINPDSLLLHADRPLPRGALVGSDLAVGAGAVPASGAAGRARLSEDRDLRVQVDCDVAEPGGWLFLADSYYPGWRARVDGVETPVWRANVAGRAIWLPAGSRQAVFEYRPASFHRGLWASGAALVAIVVGLLWCRRRAGAT